jgi:Flp pilus assembly protein TadD
MIAAVAVFAVCLATLAYLTFPWRAPEPPRVDTVGLEASVVKEIDEATLEVRETPQSGSAWGKLASILMHYEFVEEARTAFRQAARLAPQDPRWPYLHGVLLMNRDTSAAFEELGRSVTLSGGNPDMPRLRLAQFLAERGRTDDADRQFEILRRNVPGHPPASLGLARIRHAQGRSAECTNLLTECLNDPHTAKSASALLAAVLQSLGQIGAADASARRSAALPADTPWPDPYWTEASRHRISRKARIEEAELLLDEGRTGDAISALTVLTVEHPEDSEPWYLLGWALNQQKDGAAAERALREHLRLSESPKGLAQLGVSLLIQQRFAEAIEVLEKAVEVKPTWRELHSNLGFACVQLGRDDQAIAHYRNALAQDPNHVPSHTALAELLVRRGKMVEARAALREALEISPTDERARAVLLKLDSRR